MIDAPGSRSLPRPPFCFPHEAATRAQTRQRCRAWAFSISQEDRIDSAFCPRNKLKIVFYC